MPVLFEKLIISICWHTAFQKITQFRYYFLFGISQGGKVGEFIFPQPHLSVTGLHISAARGTKENHSKLPWRFLMFKVDDLAVYPAHGVGRIEAIEEKSIGGITQLFYIMRILDNDMKIMIPQNNAENVGLRNIISDEEVEQVYTILKKKDVEFTTQTWNRRYREYMEKIKTGSIFDLATVLRDLYILQMDKPLSFGEKKMMDTARGLLIKELSIARAKKESEIEEGIEAIFGNTKAAATAAKEAERMDADVNLAI